MLFKAGWTDCNGEYRQAHKFKATEELPICDGSDRNTYRLYCDSVSTRPPKNACKNCLRIDKANKKKGR